MFFRKIVSYTYFGFIKPITSVSTICALLFTFLYGIVVVTSIPKSKRTDPGFDPDTMFTLFSGVVGSLLGFTAFNTHGVINKVAMIRLNQVVKSRIVLQKLKHLTSAVICEFLRHRMELLISSMAQRTIYGFSKIESDYTKFMMEIYEALLLSTSRIFDDQSEEGCRNALKRILDNEIPPIIGAEIDIFVDENAVANRYLKPFLIWMSCIVIVLFPFTFGDETAWNLTWEMLTVTYTICCVLHYVSSVKDITYDQSGSSSDFDKLFWEEYNYAIDYELQLIRTIAAPFLYKANKNETSKFKYTKQQNHKILSDVNTTAV